MLLHERVLYSHLFDALVAIYKLSLATSYKHDVLITHDCSKKDNHVTRAYCLAHVILTTTA